jgi:hypothetical protein
VSFIPDTIQIVLPELPPHDTVLEAAVAADPAATVTLPMSAAG